MELIILAIDILAIHGAAFVLLLGIYFIQTLVNSYTKFCIKKDDRALVVVSHPDDECLFFCPTIAYLIKNEVRVCVLCLSAGNFYGLGNKRMKELIKSCKNLGVQNQDIFCLEEFNDNPNHLWSTERLAKIVKRHAIKVGASAVFTFDSGGLNGHSNHVATSKGIRYLRASGSLKGVKFYFLNTLVFLRHYIHVLDIFPSLHSVWNKPCILIVASPLDYVTAYRSVTCHSSQLVWYDYFGILFSSFFRLDVTFTFALIETISQFSETIFNVNYEDMLINTWTSGAEYDKHL